MSWPLWAPKAPTGPVAACHTWKRRTLFPSVAAGIATLYGPPRPRGALVNRRAEVLPFGSSGPEDLEGPRMGTAWRKTRGRGVHS